MKKLRVLFTLLFLAACAPSEPASTDSPQATPPSVVEPAVCQSQQSFDDLTAQSATLQSDIANTEAAISADQAAVDYNTNWLANPPAHASAAATTSHQNALTAAQSDLAVQQQLLQDQQIALSDVQVSLLVPVCN